jgi:hypothetical protein
MSFLRTNISTILLGFLIVYLFINAVGLLIAYLIGKIRRRKPFYRMKSRFKILKIIGAIFLLIFFGNSLSLSFPNPYAALINMECEAVKDQSSLKVIIDTTAGNDSNSLESAKWKRNVFASKYPHIFNNYKFGKSPGFSINSKYDFLLIFVRPAEGHLIKKIESGSICGELCGVGYEHYYLNLGIMIFYLFTGGFWIS